MNRYSRLSKSARCVLVARAACAAIGAITGQAFASDDPLVFQQCAYEANRYIVCRTPPPGAETALRAADRVHAGAAFGSYIIEELRRRGCSGAFDDKAFILNGVFFSIDSRAFEKISCPGQNSKLQFSEEKAVVFSFMQFWFD